MYTSKVGAVLDLNKEYSPSKNSKRFSEATNPDQAVVAEFVKTITEHTQTARGKYNVRQSVTYRNSGSNSNGTILDNQVLDIYYGDKENGTPIFVYIHGGYWQQLDRHTSGSFVEPLIQKGYRVVIVDYNLCPTVTLQQIYEQMKHFYEWLFNYAMETQASKISFSGHSAGAHLLTVLCNEKLLRLPYGNLIESIFLVSGVFDLRECWKLPSVNPGNILDLDTEASAAALSPICRELDPDFIELAKKRNIRIYVLVAENDSETFKEQSHAYTNKLCKAGLQVEYEVFSGYDHFSIIENVPVKSSLINNYLLSKL
ncbi:kynurenine formamidase [Eurosta solidaginis]|uniref:kynurenine formamidase n=1 Tax=Eurosta solidaginis TaxID=178769 RepID=UPI0035307FA8